MWTTNRAVEIAQQKNLQFKNKRLTFPTSTTNAWEGNRHMRLAAVTRARALAIVGIDELNLGGKLRLADCIDPIVQRYGFLVFPKEPKDFDLSDKGARFEDGKADGVTIDSLVIYDGALFVDTLSNTSDSKRILLEMLEWGRDTLGLTYVPGMIKQWGYISDIVFFSDFPLLVSMSSPVQKLAEKTSRFTEELWNGLKYEPINLSIGHDPGVRKNGVASFFIQHRINSTFAENKFFSEAPIPTDFHIKFIEEFESDVSASLKRK